MKKAALLLVLGVLPARAQEENIEELVQRTRNPVQATLRLAFQTALGIDQANASLRGVAQQVADVAEQVAELAPPAPEGPISRCVEPPAYLQAQSAAAAVTLCQGDTCQEVIQPCFPFACDRQAGTCHGWCDADLRCAAGAVCDLDRAQCVPAGANLCHDPWTVRQASGNLFRCGGYRCMGGTCRDACSGPTDCEDGYACVSGRCLR